MSGELDPRLLEKIETSSDDTLIAVAVEAQVKIAKREAALKEELKPVAQIVELARAALESRLIQRNAKHTTTKSGTAYLSDHLNVKVTNRDALLKYAQEHWDNGGGALVVIKPPVDAVRDHMAMHGDKLPPGIETSTFTRINIRGGK